MNPLLVSLSSFGATEVRQAGQLHFARLAQQAGADGVEVRGELLTGGEAELLAIAQALPALPKVFSSPEGLWSAQGRPDRAALERGLTSARTLGASRLKMSLGGYRPGASADLGCLGRLPGDAGVELLVENDQTTTAGSLDALSSFFADLDAQGLRVAMTFDIGNWHWVGECPLAAAAALGQRVAYVHCKGVQRDLRRWIAVPLADSAAPWRSVLRQMPPDQPWAIEYPLMGDDLLSVTQSELITLRDVARSMA